MPGEDVEHIPSEGCWTQDGLNFEAKPALVFAAVTKEGVDGGKFGHDSRELQHLKKPHGPVAVDPPGSE